MSGIVDRYDSGAIEYARYWAPVLVQTATRLMDEVDEHFGTDRMRLLDVGAGIGTLAMNALERWPQAEIIASDAAAGMLGYAKQRVAQGGVDPGGRLSFAVGPADQLPLDTASVDVAVSSFVLQLVRIAQRR